MEQFNKSEPKHNVCIFCGKPFRGEGEYRINAMDEVKGVCNACCKELYAIELDRVEAYKKLYVEKKP